MLDKSLARFREIFGNQEDSIVIRVPGRVNLLGEHTDYNEGFVLPTAINRYVYMVSRKRRDRRVILYSSCFREKAQFSLDHLDRESPPSWINYVQGVAHWLQEEGFSLSGIEGIIESNIPVGAGLSSSAALEIATALTFQYHGHLRISKDRLIDLARKAENQFVGVQCGLMDQFVSVMGRENKVLFLDCRSREHAWLPLDTSSCKIVICNTGVKRNLTHSAYNLRREECNQATRILQNHLKIGTLRDLTPELFERYCQILPPTLEKRTRHVVYENDRVLKAVQILKEGDLTKFGQLMNQSHQSLKTLYEVTSTELNLMVEIAWAQEGIIGAKMTGAGFGGCTVNLIWQVNAEKSIAIIKESYCAKSGLDPEIYSCQAVNGGAKVQ